MSLSVMAVRLAVKAALAPFDGPDVPVVWPTLAADRVFDSRFDVIDGRGGERTPLFVFAVETFDGLAFSSQRGARAETRGFDASARLVLSAQVTSRQRFRDDDANEEFDAEATDLLDQELADILATMQDQAWAVLDRDPLFRAVARRVTRLDAEPYPADGGDKLAVLANSLYLEPLSDGETALALVRDRLHVQSPVRARAMTALERMAATRSVIAARAAARSGTPVPFSADILAQGSLPPAPGTSSPPAADPDITVTLDPEDPIP